MLEYSQAGKAFVFGTNTQRFESFYSNRIKVKRRTVRGMLSVKNRTSK
jgi:hypothetical protein